MAEKSKRPAQPLFVPMDEIPGYKEAVAEERKNRLLAWFEVSQTICGFEVMPMTLERFNALQLCKNNVLYGESSRPDDLAQFLLVMSPEFERRELRGWFFRTRFFIKCKLTFTYSKIKKGETDAQWLRKNRKKIARLNAIRRKILQNAYQWFQDAPAGGGAGKSYYNGALGSCGLLAKHFGWDESTILKMPLARVFQYAKFCREQDSLGVAIQTKTKYRNPLFNPSDAVTAEFCFNYGRKNISNQ
jgi:hypothetical protein